jgi:hypothetical protein
MTKEAGNASEFSRVAEAARPQAMATERDMLPLRVAELQEVRPAMAALYDFTAIKAALVSAELAIPVSPSGESGTQALAAEARAVMAAPPSSSRSGATPRSAPSFEPRSARRIAPRLSRRAALIAVVTLSLGLWCVIWRAVAVAISGLF